MTAMEIFTQAISLKWKGRIPPIGDNDYYKRRLRSATNFLRRLGK